VANMTSCPYCGKLTDPKLAACPHCGGPLHTRPPQAGGASGRSAPRHQCPACKSPVQEGDIICVRCGTNLLTGQKVAEEQPPETIRPPRRWLPLLGAGVLVFLVIAGVGGLLYYLLQDPIAQAKKMAASNPLGAIASLQKYAERHPENVEAFLTLGKLQWQNQQFDNAAVSFENASKQDPKNEEAAWFAVLAAGKNEKEQGHNALIAALRRLVENHAENHRAWYMLALALGTINDLTGQTEALQKAVALDPRHAPTHRMLGVSLALQGNYPGAIEALERAAQLMPDNGDTAAALGMTLSLGGTIEEAVAALATALKQKTSLSTAAQMRLALLQMAGGNMEEALSLFRNIKSAKDASPDAQFFYALCLDANNLDTEAMAEFDRIANGSGPYAGEAAVQLALIYLQQENTQRAAEYIQRANTLGLSSARLLTLQGRLALLTNDSIAALQAFRNAVQKEPGYPAAHLELGLLSVNRGGMAEGLTELKRYLELLGPNKENTRAEEVQLLVNQIQQTVAPKEEGAKASAAAPETAENKEGGTS